MTIPPHTDFDLSVAHNGLTRQALVRTPAHLCDRPALLINLALDRRTTLDGEWYNFVPNLFLAGGHRAASLDMPFHGDNVIAGAEGLTAIAQAMAQGQDVFAEFAAIGTALIDACLARGWAAPERIFVSGTSRGGLAALHLMAHDPRIVAAAGFSPVTNLARLHEFSALADNPLVQRSSPEQLAPHLQDRPVFLSIGTEDPRVGAECCFALHARLVALSCRVPPVLFCAEGISHGSDAYPFAAGYTAGGAFLLRWCAETMKNPRTRP